MPTSDDDALGAIRFGYGLRPDRAPPPASGIADALRRPDPTEQAFPLPPREIVDSHQAELRRMRKKVEAGDPAAVARDAVIRAEKRAFLKTIHRTVVARALDSQVPFRQRLTMFWADHFTVSTTALDQQLYIGGFLDQTIAANMAGPFADLLKAVITEPMMLTYLDQLSSIGPHSRAGIGSKRGLNENLAREFIELHTLGVGGRYTQTDIREMAELLTGLSYSNETGFRFDIEIAEPGGENVLGRTYGGPRPLFRDILAAMDDIAVHPDTARHISHKLAVHFVSDDPDADLVDAMADAWQASGGDLPSVYAAMLDHPAAWSRPRAKIKPPFDLVLSTLNALGLTGQDIMRMDEGLLDQKVVGPMSAMGQPFFQAPGPDGWPENPRGWITPQRLAFRIRWAMDAPGRLVPQLPDPRDFLTVALGDAASERLRFAAEAAETPQQGIGLVVASPEFNRR